ncbi:SRPBCC domain-containing protein [Aminobacter niigataensis]|uniref:SRPBCC domain-containing protein n=1 Tax=Aminobacter niigataensis TaxID=83265 RepID=UPI0024C96CEC|nr:SRPBCC domain-containing protein [Aminobacter niigataensis]CAI2936304.1 putative glutathione S-transferase-related transmembrane protein [Aminobacter niigataensis]
MTARTDAVAAQSLSLEFSRVFDAPPVLVFKMWSSPEHLTRWWGPKGFTSAVKKLEFHKGGRYHFLILGPGGQDDSMSSGMSGTFREIVEGEKIVFTFAWDYDPDWQTLVTVTLVAEGTGTRLTFRQEPFLDIETRDSHLGGWGECLDRLADALAGRPVV